VEAGVAEVVLEEVLAVRNRGSDGSGRPMYRIQYRPLKVNAYDSANKSPLAPSSRRRYSELDNVWMTSHCATVKSERRSRIANCSNVSAKSGNPSDSTAVFRSQSKINLLIGFNAKYRKAARLRRGVAISVSVEDEGGSVAKSDEEESGVER
jgi:hypothetical protein